MNWLCDTPSLIGEIIKHSRDRAALAMPLKLFYGILGEVTKRAIEINDPQLNMLMCRLTLYSISDQTNKDYNPKWREIIQRSIDKKAPAAGINVTNSELKSLIHVMDSVQDHVQHLDRDSLYNKDVKTVKKLIAKIRSSKVKK